MYHHRIGRTLLVALCVAGCAACGGENSSTPDVRDTAERSSDGAVQAPGGRSDSASASASTSRDGIPGGDTASAGEAQAGDASRASESTPDEAPPNPNAPTVRVYQVDGTDSIEITVDARHMATNLSFDDPRCNVIFSVAEDGNAREEAKEFPLQNFLSRETPLLKVFRHRLGAGANAVSYAFAATQRILGTPRTIMLKTRSAPVISRPIGSMISREHLKIALAPSRITTGPKISDSAKLQAAPLKDAVSKTNAAITTQPSRVGTTVPKQFNREAIRPR